MFKIGNLELQSRLLLGTENLKMKRFSQKQLRHLKQMYLHLQ